MLSLLHFLEDLANAAVLALLDLLDLAHDILEEILDEHLSLLVRVEPLVNFDANHFTELVRYLSLAVLETIDLVSNRVVDLGDFTAEGDFLLRTSHLFLADPAVDAADLGFKVRAERLNRLIFALELLADVPVHLVITLAHFFNTLSALLLLHAILHLYLIPHIIDLTSTLFLLAQQAIDKVGDLDLKALLRIVLYLVQHVAEVIRVLQV